jgi:hypothetical protein
MYTHTVAIEEKDMEGRIRNRTEKEEVLMIALTFVMAPLPNSICSRCGNAGDYSETNSAYIDFGRFLTGMFVVSSPLPSYHPFVPAVRLEVKLGLMFR